MLRVLNNEQLNEIQNKEEETREAVRAIQTEQDQVVSSLAAYIRKCWEAAKRAKLPVEQQILKNMRQRKGEYEPQKLAAIRAMKSSDVFMLITDVKCRNAKDWIKDILFQPGTKPWDIEPTPLPELPPFIENRVRARVLQGKLYELFQTSAATGTPLPIEALPRLIDSELPGIVEAIKKELSQEAKKISEAMKQKIDDQLVEGRFYEALDDCVSDIILHTGFIKGPVYRREKVKTLVPDPFTGRVRVQMTQKIVEEYEKVSPLDIYPAPDSNGIDDGYLIEKTSITGSRLSAMIGVPGFSETAIRAVLQQYGKGGLREWTGIETERAQVENKDASAAWDSDKMDCLVFNGEIQGSMLRDWGMSAGEVPDADIYYPAVAWLIGNYVIKAMLNPDPLGRKIYSKASFDESDGGFWGKGLPQVIEDIQEVCNACARHIVNNVGMAGGPMVEINDDRCPNGMDPAPWRVWRSTESQMGTNVPAVRVYNIPLVADKLMVIYEKFSQIADEHSGVPAYAHGGQDVRGAGDTASGLSMLMTAAARGIKGVIKTIDKKIIEPTVERQYYLNIEKEENAALVADFKIAAKGSSSLIAKEQQAIRRAEFLKTTQNQIDFGIMGPEGRKYLLKDTARALELDADKAVPDSPPQPPPGGGVVPPPPGQAPGLLPAASPETLNAAGEPAAGKDFRLFQRGAIPTAGLG
jgi:hypothetical protein